MGTGYDNHTTRRRIIQSPSGNDMKVDDLGMIGTDSDEHWRESFDEQYILNYLTTVAPGSSVTFVITTPADGHYPHGNISFTATQASTIVLTLTSISYAEYSAVTDGDGKGTQIYAYNVNRGLNYNRCTTEFFVGDTYLTDVTWKTLGQQICGSQFRMANVEDCNQWLLDVGRVYTLILTNTSVATSTVVLNYGFHEHDAVESTVTDSTSGEANLEHNGEGGDV